MKHKNESVEFKHTSTNYIPLVDVCDVCNIRIYFDLPCNCNCVYYEYCQKHKYNQDYIMSVQKEL